MKLKRVALVTFIIFARIEFAIYGASTASTISFTTTTGLTTTNPTLSPECSNYKFLNESDRAQTYNKKSPVLCDDNTLGWYRFGGGAGNQMPESCVSGGHCGAKAPGWLNGSHPSLADGAVKRKVCFHWPSLCCLFETYITVRNCGGFYVYKLTPLRICASRYCGNGLRPAPATTARPARETTPKKTAKPTRKTTPATQRSSTKLPTKEISSTTPLVTPTEHLL